DRHGGGGRSRPRGTAARALRRRAARRGHRRARRPGCGARLGREPRARPTRAGAPRAQPRCPHRDLHRRGARRQPRRARRRRRAGHRRARPRRDRVGRGCVARRSAARARRGARGCHRGTRTARGAVDIARGLGVRRRVTLGLGALRATGVGALVLLIWNPPAGRLGAGDAPRLVLLDASLSMAARGAHWAAALDTARALAHGDVIWRFGARLTAFDTLAPRDGATRLAPALAAAAARGGPVAIVTDGAIFDRADAPADLLRSARIVVLPRTPFFDAFVSSVDGPARVGAGDTVRLRVSYGTAGKRASWRTRSRTSLRQPSRCSWRRSRAAHAGGMPPPWRRCPPKRWRARCRARSSWSKPVIPPRSRESRPREPSCCGRSGAARKATGMSSRPPRPPSQAGSRV